MDRDSTTHGPAVDDQLAHESEGLVRGRGTTHAEKWKETEPTDERTDRAAGQQPEYRQPGAPPGMTPHDVAVRSNLAGVIAAAEFPATRESLLAFLDEIVASGPVVHAIAAVPPDREFANPGDVAEALGIPRESHRF